jgi:UDP-N-acetylglucosamine--N-acetylmuramyl-(pentapeptide) pyrophosphoryl-undecaprenol N-acetylglucosamine transferase
MRVLLACERSGGHIFPALVIGKKMRERLTARDPRSEVYFFATSNFLKEYLEKEGFLVYGRAFFFRSLIFEIPYRAIEAIYLIFKLRPQKIIGFGGRDSFFLILFGSLLFLDTSIYEPNIKLGKANRILSFFVNRILCGFEDKIKNKKLKFIGIPLRENIKIIDRDQALQTLKFNNKPVIFCFGGSQGASFINNVFASLIADLNIDCQIIHLTGIRDYFEIVKLYNKIDKKAFVKDFYYNMEILYSAADIVISRAGASTLGEISHYQLPSILIPHPRAGGHQKERSGFCIFAG